jgi:hypothetical protein
MNLPQQLFWLLFVALSPAWGEIGMSANEVKASFVVNFIKFAEWPEGAIGNDGVLNLCVMGNGSLGKVLGRLDGRRIKEHNSLQVQIKQFGDDLNGCQAVVVGESERQKAAAIIRQIGYAPVLTISSIEGFAEKGGCIGLLYQENRMLFEVNLDMLRKKGLQMPAQVLNLAANVFGK